MRNYKIYSLVIGFLFIITGCTNSSTTSNPTTNTQKLLAQGDGNFGVVNFNTSGFKNFTFKNDSASSISLTPEIVGNFEQISLGCQTVLPGRSCLVKVVFNANKESGIYNGELKVGGLTFPLIAEIASVPLVVYQFFIDGVETVSNSSLGILSGNNLKLMTVKVKNNSPKTGSISSLISSSNKFNLVYNACLNVVLKPNQSCVAKMVVQGDNSGSLLSTNLNFDNQGPILDLTQEVVNLSSEFIPLNSSITLGDVYKEGENRIQILTVENQGAGVGSIADVVVPPGFTLVSNNCLSIKPGNKCLIRVAYRTSEIPKGQYTNQIELGDDATVDVVVNQVTDPNKLDKIELSVASDILINSCAPILINLKDIDNLDYITSQSVNLISNESLYNDSNCSNLDNSLAAFEPSKTFYLKKSSVGNMNLQISYNTKSSQKTINWYDSLSASIEPFVVNGQTSTLTVSGGKSPYQFSVIMGSGTVDALGVYQSVSPGDIIISVTDSLNLSTSVSFKVVAPLQLSAQNLNQVVNSSQTVAASGGLAPYTYSIQSGLGSMNSSSGIYTAGASSGTSTLKVTDSSGQMATIDINVVSVLTINPTSASLVVAGSTNFSGVGGLAPYSYAVISGGGTINSTTGAFTASNTAGSATIRVTDALNQNADAIVTVSTNISIGAGNCSFLIPESMPCTVTSAGGIGTRSYSTNAGVIDSATGVFKGSCVNNNGSSVVTVTDQFGNSAQTTLSYPCVYKSCNQIRAESYGVTNGDYWIDMDGLNSGTDPFKLYCDVTNSSGAGLTMISSGGSACGVSNFTVKSSVSLNGNCGYLSEPVVRALSQNAQQVTLRAGASHSSYQEAKSSGTVTLNALRNGTNWSPGGSSGNFTEFTNTIGSWAWNYSCANVYVSQWPNMYQTCNNGSGVHWLSSTSVFVGQSNTSGPNTTSSTWLLTKYFKLPSSCLDARDRGILNQAGNTNSGIYSIDPDGFAFGNAPFNVYCDQSTNTGGWTLNYEQNNYSLNTTSSQFISSAITSGASEVMVVYGNVARNYVSTPYKFSKPANFDLWNVATGTISSTAVTNLNTGSVANQQLIYGYYTFGNTPCDPWNTSTTWGRFGICVLNNPTDFNDFPYYTSYSTSAASGTNDQCNASNQGYNSIFCSDNRRLLIFFR